MKNDGKAESRHGSSRRRGGKLAGMMIHSMPTTERLVQLVGRPFEARGLIPFDDERRKNDGAARCVKLGGYAATFFEYTTYDHALRRHIACRGIYHL